MADQKNNATNFATVPKPRYSPRLSNPPPHLKRNIGELSYPPTPPGKNKKGRPKESEEPPEQDLPARSAGSRQVTQYMVTPYFPKKEESVIGKSGPSSNPRLTLVHQISDSPEKTNTPKQNFQNRSEPQMEANIRNYQYQNFRSQNRNNQSGGNSQNRNNQSGGNSQNWNNQSGGNSQNWNNQSGGNSQNWNNQSGRNSQNRNNQSGGNSQIGTSQSGGNSQIRTSQSGGNSQIRTSQSGGNSQIGTSQSGGNSQIRTSQSGGNFQNRTESQTEPKTPNRDFQNTESQMEVNNQNFHNRDTRNFRSGANTQHRANNQNNQTGNTRNFRSGANTQHRVNNQTNPSRTKNSGPWNRPITDGNLYLSLNQMSEKKNNKNHSGNDSGGGGSNRGDRTSRNGKNDSRKIVENDEKSRNDRTIVEISENEEKVRTEKTIPSIDLTHSPEKTIPDPYDNEDYLFALKLQDEEDQLLEQQHLDALEAAKLEEFPFRPYSYLPRDRGWIPEPLDLRSVGEIEREDEELALKLYEQFSPLHIKPRNYIYNDDNHSDHDHEHDHYHDGDSDGDRDRDLDDDPYRIPYGDHDDDPYHDRDDDRDYDPVRVHDYDSVRVRDLGYDYDRERGQELDNQLEVMGLSNFEEEIFRRVPPRLRLVGLRNPWQQQNQFEAPGQFSYEALTQLEDVKVGVDQGYLATMPVFTFTNQNLPDKQCSICMEIFSIEEELRRLSCFHCFHKSCIDPWLSKSKRCPVCNVDITSI